MPIAIQRCVHPENTLLESYGMAAVTDSHSPTPTRGAYLPEGHPNE